MIYVKERKKKNKDDFIRDKSDWKYEVQFEFVCSVRS